MVGMQARLLTDPTSQDAVTDTQRRIDAIAQVHRNLYTSKDVHSVEMDDYLAALIAELESTWSTPAAPRKIELQSEALRLHADKAVSLGVIVNELVTNACKYAYEPDAPGVIRVDFAREGETHFQLSVEDEGRGMPSGEAPRGTGLGTKLINAMARSLGSEVVYGLGTRGGVKASLRAAAA
jgi:two-component sensor histidine kinase